MGILTRQQGELFVITSDHTEPGPAAKKAPRRMNEAYLVWTGDNWSMDLAMALTFDSLNDADDYVRANYAKVSR